MSKLNQLLVPVMMTNAMTDGESYSNLKLPEYHNKPPKARPNSKKAIQARRGKRR
ncbi:MAG: hypothetical protein FWH42_01400 [Dehalococcoidia bacterium]|nr:hypothetical protein [Dehalococcoidia bacterium]